MIVCVIISSIDGYRIMPRFSQESSRKLAECHQDLQDIAALAILISDFKVITGHRNRAEQNRLYDIGRSQVEYPDSKHNSWPSNAFDLAPWPIDWEDTSRFYVLAGVILACAHILKIEIRWGGDWDSDGDLTEERFKDLGHFELVEKGAS